MFCTPGPHKVVPDLGPAGALVHCRDGGNAVGVFSVRGFTAALTVRVAEGVDACSKGY